MSLKGSFYLSLESKIIRPCHLPGYIINPEPLIERRGGLPADIYDTDNLAPRYPEGIASARESEKRLIRQTLVCSGHNLSRAAASLGISPTTVYRKIRKYQIETAVSGKAQSKVAVGDRK
jgi:transcriptional regulator with PAS, ATPase and Fis domain